MPSSSGASSRWLSLGSARTSRVRRRDLAEERRLSADWTVLAAWLAPLSAPITVVAAGAARPRVIARRHGALLLATIDLLSEQITSLEHDFRRDLRRDPVSRRPQTIAAI